MYGQGPFGKALDVAAQVTGGVCPTCSYETMFVSLSPEIYRCMNCGFDVEQKVNSEFGLSISLMDERAMSLNESPFRTIQTLANFIDTLIGETDG